MYFRLVVCICEDAQKRGAQPIRGGPPVGAGHGAALSLGRRSRLRAKDARALVAVRPHSRAVAW